jgi:hypothetical protein
MMETHNTMSTAAEPFCAPQTIATAPDTSKPFLEQIKKSYGFMINAFAGGARNSFGERTTIMNWLITLLNTFPHERP